MRIQVLPDLVINQISAGEVVERPSSVVRELVDNAIDAGASDVCVELEEGGQQLIRVSDNGCGMSSEEALLSFQRHATSKIRSADDLENIATMGFRGEALPSIAAVSRVRMLTRTAAEALGAEIKIEGGNVLSTQQVPATRGTLLEVHSLFWNVPARRKFLKSDKTEVGRVKTWLSQSALAHPDVRYRLLVEGKEVLNFPKVADELRRAQALFRGALVPFVADAGAYGVRGAVGHPSAAQFDTSAFVVLVNGRLVTDRMVLRAVKDGFDSTLKDREYPLGFVHIRVPAAELDVNVHPQKSEVRFREGGKVFALVRETVLTAVRSFRDPLAGQTALNPPTQWRSDLGIRNSGAHTPLLHSPRVAETIPVFGAQRGLPFTAATKAAAAQDDGTGEGCEPLFSEMRYLGQILGCYLLCEWRDAFYVIDMHAAHERYNYNLIRKRLRERSADSQQLLVPLVVELSERGVQQCLDLLPCFAPVGFEWEQLGPTALVVRGVPSFFAHAQVVDVVRDIAALAESNLNPASFEQEVDHVAARLACHASIRSGRELERAEVYALFEALDSTEFSAACPHGRPIAVRFQREDIETWFGRDR